VFGFTAASPAKFPGLPGRATRAASIEKSKASDNVVLVGSADGVPLPTGVGEVATGLGVSVGGEGGLPIGVGTKVGGIGGVAPAA